MKKAFVTLALVGFMVFTGQAASAGARRQGKIMRPFTTMSERIRNAHASVLPTENRTNQTFQYDEALSPPAGH
jgi:hypothetical protein